MWRQAKGHVHLVAGSLYVLDISFLIYKMGIRNPHLAYLSGWCEDPLGHVIDPFEWGEHMCW